MATEKPPPRITLIGAGTIGLSFAALYLVQKTQINVTIYDTRSDLDTYISSNLPSYFSQLVPKNASKEPIEIDILYHQGLLRVATSLEDAVSNASVVQEQGPENLAFKSSLWPEVERYAPPNCFFWSSTSGIPASQQSKNMSYPGRLVVVHPYNPPHIMPLIEIVPSPTTNEDVVDGTVRFWKSIGREPVVLKKECTGFVANRLAFALLREAIHLVDEGVVSVEELDTIVLSSMGPRWAVAGPFKSYHAGGGHAGLEGFFKNIGGTVQECWDDSGRPVVGEGEWEKEIFTQTREAYGVVDVAERDKVTKRVLEAIKG